MSAPVPSVARILATYDATTADERRAGARWYGAAWLYAESLSREFPRAELSTEHVAGIIAALSPRARWSTNIDWARSVVRARAQRRGCPPVSTGANRRAAWRIARGEDPGAVLMGPKVAAFWRAICGDARAVCVDIWAIRVACAEDFAPTRKQSGEIAAAYTVAAEARGISPRDIQAATWVHARGAAD
jgi:hypothetical protein